MEPIQFFTGESHTSAPSNDISRPVSALYSLILARVVHVYTQSSRPILVTCIPIGCRSLTAVYHIFSSHRPTLLSQIYSLLFIIQIIW
jgi:hypothetical protein